MFSIVENWYVTKTDLKRAGLGRAGLATLKKNSNDKSRKEKPLKNRK